MVAERVIIYVDMDDVLADFSTRWHQVRAEQPELRYPQSIEGFFSNLDPIRGAVESVNWLRSLEQCSVYILTAPSVRNVHSYTEKRIWTEKWFDYEFAENLIICRDKSLLKGDVLIDDNVCGKGQELFEGVLYEFGSDRFPDWTAVIAQLSSDLV